MVLKEWLLNHKEAKNERSTLMRMADDNIGHYGNGWVYFPDGHIERETPQGWVWEPEGAVYYANQ